MNGRTLSAEIVSPEMISAQAGIILHMITTTDTHEADPPGELSADLCWLLARASALLNAESTAALRELGITPRQHYVLVTARSGEHTQTDLARTVGLDKTTLMVTLDELERTGLAERRRRPGDRRAWEVTITPKGQRTLERARGLVTQVEDEVLDGLTTADRGQLLTLLRRALLSAPPQPPWRPEEGD